MVLFSNTNGVLTAQCNVEDNPCNLDIQISKKTIVDIKIHFLIKFIMILKLIKLNIISTKLDLLFGLEDESITVKLFQDYKNDYKNNLKIY